MYALLTLMLAGVHNFKHLNNSVNKMFIISSYKINHERDWQ